MKRILCVCVFCVAIALTAIVLSVVVARRHDVAERSALDGASKSAAATGMSGCVCSPSMRCVVMTNAVGDAVKPIPQDARMRLCENVNDAAGDTAAVRRKVSDKNQVMDSLLGGPDVPSDYCETMIGLFRDRSQDVYTREFAVQHLGLYAESLRRRGKYDPSSPETAELRRALDDATAETGTVVAAAAFRALADVSGFDAQVERRRLDARLELCAGDASASVAARVMAVQLCGERRVMSARQRILGVAADVSAPVVLRKAASHALSCLDGKEIAQ